MAVARRFRWVGAVALMASGLVVSALMSQAKATTASPSDPSGLPAGVAAAATLPEPVLPVPAGWSFPDDFSRTAGTGRLVGGAFEWTDWVYDAFGPASGGPSSNSDLSQARGSYVYPAGSADGDGADIFRAAVGLTTSATVWRVDWNTLADPKVPIAEWTFDTDNDPATGASAWPADANVSSPGIEEALVVSSRGAELVDATSGTVVARFPTTVDSTARSFLVNVPRTALPVAGSWRIRLAAGLADPTGTSFALPQQSGGPAVSSTAPRVYNITFRTVGQEPAVVTSGQSGGAVSQVGSALQSVPVAGQYGVAGVATEVTGNTWGDGGQADTLAGGDVSKYAQVVEWAQLAAGTTTPAPLIYGWSTRWYVTDLQLGQGIAPGSPTNPLGPQPLLLGRIQPYAVYVPTGYEPSMPAPLTWMLHGAGQAYTWAETGEPRLSLEACQDRRSICVSTEGFGPTGYYIGQAEHDFWQVWRQATLGFTVAPDRTLITGYSMGGLGSFVLSATYPSVFSEAMPLDGSFDAGCSPLPANGTADVVGPAAPDRSGNIHWVPMVVTSAYADELSLYPYIMEDVARYEGATDRFTLFSTTGGEHVVTEVEDGFSAQVAALHGTPAAATDPGTIDYTWCPQVVDRGLGLGPTSVYWLSGLSQRVVSTSTTSRVVANDGAIPEPAETEQTAASVVTPSDAPPMQVLSGTWTPGATAAPTSSLALSLTDVATVTVDMAAAHLPQGTASIVSDGPATLTLSQLQPGTKVVAGGNTIVVGGDGQVMVPIRSGTSTIAWQR